MGANGSKAAGTTETEEGRNWKTIELLANGVKVINLKKPNAPGKMPEESHSPSSIYAMMNKNGEGIKAISIYDENCKKVVEIHTTDHKGLGAHFHVWQDGRPIEVHSLKNNRTWNNLLRRIKKNL
jgi:hypothetical protein